MVVIDPADVGKALGSVMTRAAMTARVGGGVGMRDIGPGSVWWARAMGSPPSGLVRTVMRPRTLFDRISLLDIQRLFKTEILHRRVYTDLDDLGQLLLLALGELAPPLHWCVVMCTRRFV